jgi:putative transposase
MLAYNTGLAYSGIFKLVGKVNWKTIEGWKRMVKNSGETFNLCDRRGFCVRGKSKITDDEKNILLACALHSNQLLISEIIRSARDIMEVRGIYNFLSDATYTRYLNYWRSRHNHIWTWQREGKSKWNDECCIDIERYPDSIKVGDVLVADGHTLNFEILNPWTGKPKRMTLILWYDMRSNFPLGWEIMPTEDTAAISSALRRAIIRLGKIPKVVYLDNGKAFRGKYFTQTDDFTQTGLVGLYERLGCQPVFAWAYHGQSKTIERFFGTMAEMERRTITYTGTSIEKKPPRMNRGEYLHREAYEKITQGGCITLEQAHISIATWFDKYINRKQKGKWLKNKTPLDLFLPGKGPGVDPVGLRHLMMSLVIKRINKNGITYQGKNYYSHELYGRNHKAIVRYDLQDKTFVEVSDENDEFICVALPKVQTHAMARLGTEEDRNELAEQIKYKRHQEKLAGASTREFLEDTILPEHKMQLANIKKAGEIEDKTRRIEAPAKLTEQDKKKILAEAKRAEVMDEAPEVIAMPEIASEAEEAFGGLSRLSEMDKYEKLIELEISGILIPKQHQAFMSYFEMTDDYKGQQDYFEEHRAKMATMYQIDLTTPRRGKGAN